MKNKIIFLLPHLKAGGAERVVSFIFKSLDRTLFEPYLIVLGFETEAQYDIKGENIIFLDKKRLRSALLAIAIKIRQLKPSIVFGSIGHINIYLGFLKIFFPRTKFVAREASVYNKMMSFNDKKQLPKVVLNSMYKNLDALVYQSLDMKIDFEKTFEINTNKGYLIHNPITFPPKGVKETKQIKSSVFKFIIVGSLVRNKGHERVLKLFEKVKFDFTLEIVGDGPLKDYIKKLLVHSPIKDKVFFKGLQSKIESIYENADFLIQGSYVEGFPNVVLEALSFGIPCIVFDAPGGHKELINEAKNAFFIYDSDKPNLVLQKAVNYSWDRNEIQKDVFNRFDSNKILNEYEEMFQKILRI